MSHQRQHKPDSLAVLFVIVTLGMLWTSFVQAEDYLFGQPEVDGQSVGSDSFVSDFQSRVLPPSEGSWLLLPGTGGMKTSFNGGMAHFLFGGHLESDSTGYLSSNTRLIFSMGVEESDSQSNKYQPDDSAEWYDRYEPTLYFTFGHRW